RPGATTRIVSMETSAVAPSYACMLIVVLGVHGRAGPAPGGAAPGSHGHELHFVAGRHQERPLPARIPHSHRRAPDPAPAARAVVPRIPAHLPAADGTESTRSRR